MPFSVNAYGKYFIFSPRVIFKVAFCDLDSLLPYESVTSSFKVTNCDLENKVSLASSFVN